MIQNRAGRPSSWSSGAVLLLTGSVDARSLVPRRSIQICMLRASDTRRHTAECPLQTASWAHSPVRAGPVYGSVRLTTSPGCGGKILIFAGLPSAASDRFDHFAKRDRLGMPEVIEVVARQCVDRADDSVNEVVHVGIIPPGRPVTEHRHGLDPDRSIA